MPKDARKTKVTIAVAKPRVSIRTRIMVLALLLIVPLMVERFHLLENTRSERIARAVSDVMDLAQRGTEAQSETMDSTRALLQIVARTYLALAAAPQNCTAFLTGFTTDVPWMRGLSIVGPDGRIACSTRPTAVGIDVSDRDYIRRAREAHDFVLSDYMIGRANNQPAIMAAFSAPGIDERLNAVVIAPIELQWVARFAHLIEVRKGATAFLLDGRGTVVLELPDHGKYVGQNLPDHPLIQAASSQKTGTVTTQGLDGVHRIYAFSELPGTDNRIVVGIDEREALGRIDRDISITYFELSLFGLVGMLLAWFGGEYFIIEPIRALSRTAASIGRGKLEAPVSRSNWTAEFAPLAQALSEMAEKLAEREAELRTANSQLEELALLDGMSGLPNRRAFDLRLASSWRAGDPTSPVSLLMIDVDYFKLFNDTHGHLEGDACLRMIGKSLESLARPIGFAARYGGEEFVVLLPGIGADEARELGERTRCAIEALQIPHTAAPSGFVSVSIGVATLRPDQHATEYELVEAADAALYLAKRRGRNTVSVWTPPPAAKAS